MKKPVLAALAVTALLVAFAVAGCGDEIPAGAIATVGDGVVTQAEFDKLIDQAKEQAKSQGAQAAPFPSPGTPQYNQYAARVVDYLVTQKLIEQQAGDLKVSVSDKEVADRVKQIEDAYGGKKKVEGILKKQGMTMADLEKLMRDQILSQKVYQAATKDAKPTEAEMKKYFEEHQSEFEQPLTRTVRHVLTKTEAEAQKVRELLLADGSDANWKKVAKEYSEDPGTKDNGGNLGPIRKGMMVPPFDKVAWSLKAKVLSEPVKSQFGWHVIEVLSVNPGKTTTFEEAKARIQQALVSQLQQTAWDNWLKKAKEDAKIQYAPGFDPAKLTAAPSPAGSPASPAPAATGQ